MLIWVKDYRGEATQERTGDLGAQPVETLVYNCNTHITPKFFLLFSFVRHFELSGGLRLYSRSQIRVPRSCFPVPSFSNIRA